MIKVTKVEKLFPSIEEVFESPKEWFKYVFFPLLTVEIENEQQQKSKAHFVSMFVVWQSMNQNVHTVIGSLCVLRK